MLAPMRRRDWWSSEGEELMLGAGVFEQYIAELTRMKLRNRRPVVFLEKMAQMG